MHLIISIFLALSPAHAQDDTGTSCAEWGTIAEQDNILNGVQAGDDPIQLNVYDPAECDTENDPICRWEILGDYPDIPGSGGQLFADCNPEQSGSDSAQAKRVCYVPPETLYNCERLDIQIKLECDAGNGGEGAADDIVAGTLTDLSPECTTTASVSGGGCISAQGSGVTTASAWLLFPLLGIGAWIRRRED